MNRRVVLWVALFTVVAVGRIISTYKETSQCFDEPTHIAAGIELLDKGTYTFDPMHPPLSRWAIGIPIYLVGERYPTTGLAATSKAWLTVGNSIIYNSGHSLRNLVLARIGVLAFFLYAVAVVFLWSRHEFGDLAAVMAVVLFTTLPVVLAFSSIAYSDMAAGSTQAAALFSFLLWLKRQTVRSTLLLGVSLGLALSAKFTTLIFVPAGAVGIWITKWLLTRNAGFTPHSSPRQLVRHVGIVLLIVSIMLWGAYGFSVGHIRESMQLPIGSNPQFHRVPPPLRGVALRLMRSDPVIPAPALLNGLQAAFWLNHSGTTSYLLGRMKLGGWWFFFPVAIVFKSPLPFLLLVLVGLLGSCRLESNRRWSALAPAVAALAILAATTHVNYQVGVRHVMVVFPLLAIMGGYGCSCLWWSKKNWHGVSALLVGLLIWQAVSTYRAGHDFIAFFSELAGQDPSRILVKGCDLDCGQDLYRLSEVLKTRNVSHLNLAVFSSADMSQMKLPAFTVPEPSTPTHGWLAISMRSMRVGEVFSTHYAYPPDAFAWLNRYQPVEKVGKTIWLYYIP